MEYDLLIARSVTHAQRIAQALARVGIRAQIFHAPLELTGGRGCSYAVRIRPSALPETLQIISEAGLGPVQVFSFDANGYREVRT